MLVYHLDARQVVAQSRPGRPQQVLRLRYLHVELGNLLQPVLVCLALGHRVGVQAETLCDPLHFLQKVIRLAENQNVSRIAGKLNLARFLTILGVMGLRLAHRADIFEESGNFASRKSENELGHLICLTFLDDTRDHVQLRVEACVELLLLSSCWVLIAMPLLHL